MSETSPKLKERTPSPKEDPSPKVQANAKIIFVGMKKLTYIPGTKNYIIEHTTFNKKTSQFFNKHTELDEENSNDTIVEADGKSDDIEDCCDLSNSSSNTAPKNTPVSKPVATKEQIEDSLS